MNNFYSNALYITESYLYDLERVKSYIKKLNRHHKKTMLNKRLYKKIAYNKKMDMLLSDTINYPDDKELLAVLHTLQEQMRKLKAKTEKEYTPFELKNVLEELNEQTGLLTELLYPKVKPWNRYIPLFKLFSIRIGKAKAGIIIAAWFTLFILLPVIGNLLALTFR